MLKKKVTSVRAAEAVPLKTKYSRRHGLQAAPALGAGQDLSMQGRVLVPSKQQKPNPKVRKNRKYHTLPRHTQQDSMHDFFQASQL